MKTRFKLSLVVAFLYFLLLEGFNFLYSPITGVATAQSLNDDVASYGWAKFIRDGGVQSTLFFASLAALLVIWFWPKRKAVQ